MPDFRSSFLRLLGTLSATMAGCWAPLTLADATLIYEITDANGDQSQHTFTIVERFVRIDSNNIQSGYWLYDSGFRKLHRVDNDKQQYKLVRIFDNPHIKTTATTPSTEKSEQATAKPEPKSKLIPTKEKKSIAGVQCRVIQEKLDNQVVAQHCMAGTGPLGMTKREVYTLARLLTAPGKLQFGWPGTATSDELFASVQSMVSESKQGLELKSISHDTVPDERVQIPKAYKNLDAPAPAPAKEVSAEEAPAGQTPAKEAPVKNPEDDSPS